MWSSELARAPVLSLFESAASGSCMRMFVSLDVSSVGFVVLLLALCVVLSRIFLWTVTAMNSGLSLSCKIPFT